MKNIICIVQWVTHPVRLYQCVNSLIEPKKYGKNLMYGLPRLLAHMVKIYFHSLFNENYTDEEVDDISNRLN